MSSPDKENLGRRAFLRSMFGLSTLAESAIEANASAPARFYWGDLRTGQVGFPTGQSVPCGRPGSIMKLVAVTTLLETRSGHVDDKFECRGSYKVGKETVNCLYPHGIVDLVHALGLSCNVYFAHASEKLSPRALLDFAQRLGLNTPVGKLGGGKFPSAPADHSLNYVLGLAPDLEPSALQLLRLAAVVATRGQVKYLHSAESPDPTAADFTVDLSASTWNALRQGMQIAGREGTGKKLDLKNELHVALKTGTVPHGKAFESWVCGYFPWNEPHYAFCLRSPYGTSYEQAIPALRKFLFGTTWP